MFCGASARKRETHFEAANHIIYYFTENFIHFLDRHVKSKIKIIMCFSSACDVCLYTC
jgi:hypothetical protein